MVVLHSVKFAVNHIALVCGETIHSQPLVGNGCVSYAKGSYFQVSCSALAMMARA